MTTAPVPRLAPPDEIASGACDPAGNWAERSLCKGSADLLWITRPKPDTRPHQIELADEVCGRCPVKRECREWAATGSRTSFEGVAGGVLWPSGAACQFSHRADRWCASCQGFRLHGKG